MPIFLALKRAWIKGDPADSETSQISKNFARFLFILLTRVTVYKCVSTMNDLKAYKSALNFNFSLAIVGDYKFNALKA